jgi:hypothetical protein
MRGHTAEDEDLLRKVYTMKVDFVYLDQPLVGMRFRDINLN